MKIIQARFSLGLIHVKLLSQSQNEKIQIKSVSIGVEGK